jgi:hypothetical protein
MAIYIQTEENMNVKMRIYEPNRLTLVQQRSRMAENRGRPLAFYYTEVMVRGTPMRAVDFTPFPCQHLADLAAEHHKLRILSPKGSIVPIEHIGRMSPSDIDELALKIDSVDHPDEILWERVQSGWKAGNALIDYVKGDAAKVNIAPFFDEKAPFLLWSGTGEDLFRGIVEGFNAGVSFYYPTLEKVNTQRKSAGINSGFRGYDFIKDNFITPMTNEAFKAFELFNKLKMARVNIPIVRFGAMENVIEKFVQESTLEIGQGISNFLANHPNTQLNRITFSIFSYKDLIQQAKAQIHIQKSLDDPQYMGFSLN